MERGYRCFAADVFVPDDAGYIDAVEDILCNAAFLSMKGYVQHGGTSCLQHCVAVSWQSWRACKKLGLGAREAARGALLHDLFLYDWHSHRRRTGSCFHGLTHPRAALENAAREFSLSRREGDIILKHMWPLTFVPPRFSESWVVSLSDKLCTLRETLRGLKSRGRKRRRAAGLTD